MKKMLNYAKLFWPVIAIVILTFILYNFFDSARDSLVREIEQADNSIASIELDLGRSQQVVDQYKSAMREIAPYISSLFSVKEPDSLIAMINEISSAHKIKLADIRLDVPKFIEVRGKTESISIVPFEMTFTGDYFSLGKFVVDLEGEPFLQSISDAGLSNDTESGDRLKLILKGAFRFFSDDIIRELKNHGA